MFRFEKNRTTIIKTLSNSTYSAVFDLEESKSNSHYKLYKGFDKNQHIYIIQSDAEDTSRSSSGARHFDLTELKLENKCKFIIDFTVNSNDTISLPCTVNGPYFIKGSKCSIRIQTMAKGWINVTQPGGVIAPSNEPAVKKTKIDIDKAISHSSELSSDELNRRKPKFLGAARIMANIKPLAPSPDPLVPAAAPVPSLELKKSLGSDSKALTNTEQRKRGIKLLGDYLDLQSSEMQVDSTIELRDHQKRKLIELYNLRKKSPDKPVKGVNRLPTGSGKTFIFAAISKITQEKTLVFVPKDILRDQTIKEYKDVAPNLKVIDLMKEVGSKFNEKSEEEQRKIYKKIFSKADVIVLTYQYAKMSAARYKLFPMELVNIVVYDEAHNCCSQTSLAMTQYFFSKGCDIHAYTASTMLGKANAKRKDGGAKTVFDAIGLPESENEFSTIEVTEAIDLKINCPIVIEHVTVSEDQKGELTLETKNKDYKDKDVSEIINKDKYNLIIAKIYANSQDRKTKVPYRGTQGVVFCCDVQHAKDVEEQLNKALRVEDMDPDGRCREKYAQNKQEHYIKQGKLFTPKDMEDAKKEFCVTKAIYSKGMKKTERKKIIEQCRLGGILLLAGVDIPEEGFNIPAIKIAFCWRPTKSPRKKIQGVGRVLRLIPNDPNAFATVFELVPGDTECFFYIYELKDKEGRPQCQYGTQYIDIEEYRKTHVTTVHPPIEIKGVAEFQSHDTLSITDRKVFIGGREIRAKSTSPEVKTIKPEKKSKTNSKKIDDLPKNISDSLKQLISGVDKLDEKFIRFQKEVTVIFEASEEKDKPKSRSGKKTKPKDKKDGSEKKGEAKNSEMEDQVGSILDKATRKLTRIESYIAPPKRYASTGTPESKRASGKEEKIVTLQERMAGLLKKHESLYKKITQLYLISHVPSFAPVVDESKDLNEQIQAIASEIEAVNAEFEAKQDEVKKCIYNSKQEQKEIKEEKRNAKIFEKAKKLLEKYASDDINIYNMFDVIKSSEVDEAGKTFSAIARLILKDENKRQKLISWRNSANGSILHYFANMKSGSVRYHDVIDILLESELGLDVNLQNRLGLTPLNNALLLDKKDSNKRGWQALRYTLYVTTKLIEAGAKCYIKNLDGNDPLQHAVKNDDFAMAVYLYAHGFRLQPDARTEIMLLHAKARPGNEISYEVLQELASPKTSSRLHELKNSQCGRTLLHYVMNIGIDEISDKVMLWFKDHIDVIDKSGNTALHHVFLAGKKFSRDYKLRFIGQDKLIDITKKLIEKYGANMYLLNAIGLSPLHYAFMEIQERCIETLSYLFSKCEVAHLNSKTRAGQTILHLFCQNEFRYFNSKNFHMSTYKKLMTLLHKMLERGLDVSLKDQDGCTPLYEALKMLSDSNVEIVMTLIDKCSDIHVANNAGETLLHALCSAGFNNLNEANFKKVYLALLAKGLNPNVLGLHELFVVNPELSCIDLIKMFKMMVASGMDPLAQHSDHVPLHSGLEMMLQRAKEIEVKKQTCRSAAEKLNDIDKSIKELINFYAEKYGDIQKAVSPQEGAFIRKLQSELEETVGNKMKYIDSCWSADSKPKKVLPPVHSISGSMDLSPDDASSQGESKETIKEAKKVETNAIAMGRDVVDLVDCDDDEEMSKEAVAEDSHTALPLSAKKSVSMKRYSPGSSRLFTYSGSGAGSGSDKDIEMEDASKPGMGLG